MEKTEAKEAVKDGPDEHKGLIEAALLMSSEPLSMEKISRIAEVHSLGYIKNIMLTLEKEYAERGFHLVENSDGWLFEVDNRFLSKVSRLTPYSDLPEGEKRCLALVAYKEPMAQAEVIKIQGNKAYSYIKNLVRKGLIKTEKKGRSKSLSLTKEFERYFGESKEAIRERLLAKINRKENEI